MSQDDFPRRVRDERKRQGWTQQQLADAANVSLRTIQMFEGRKSASTPANRRAIAEALGIDENGSDVAAETRASWAPPVQVFLDMFGAYLSTMSDEDQMRAIHDWTRRIFDERNR
jgi:transcriptional regulator with XRE-family HTH domain